MKILKFGGTSVGSAENLHKIKDILIGDDQEKIVVCSAMSGVTDQLIDLDKKIQHKKILEALEILNSIENKHLGMIESLISSPIKRLQLKDHISAILMELFELHSKDHTSKITSTIITTGEILLTHIFSCFLNEIGVFNELIEAQKFMCIDEIGNPKFEEITLKLKEELHKKRVAKLYITQGFICKNNKGEISHFSRGGSDYTATVIGAALNVKEIQIWTDIDGLQNNDPRYVSETYCIPEISYGEATSLAYFGAKILHPRTVDPLVEKGIQVVLKNTFSPESQGTIISHNKNSNGCKAVSAKDNMTVFTIKSRRHLQEYEYYEKVFKTFKTHKVSIHMVTTSGDTISLIIDDISKIDAIIQELNTFSEVKIAHDFSVLCIVGNSLMCNRNSFKIFEALKNAAVRMISYGSNDNCVNILIHTKDKVQTLNFLNEQLFRVAYETV